MHVEVKVKHIFLLILSTRETFYTASILYLYYIGWRCKDGEDDPLFFVMPLWEASFSSTDRQDYSVRERITKRISTPLDCECVPTTRRTKTPILFYLATTHPHSFYYYAHANYELIRLIRFVSRKNTQLSKNIYKQILFNIIK